MAKISLDKIRRRISNARLKGIDHLKAEIEYLQKSGLLPAELLQEIIKNTQQIKDDTERRSLYIETGIADAMRQNTMQQELNKEKMKRQIAREIYNDFLSIHREFLNFQTTRNENLKATLKYIKDSKPLPAALINKLIQADEELEKRALQWQKTEKLFENIKEQKRDVKKIDEELKNRGNLSEVDKNILNNERKQCLIQDIKEAQEVIKHCNESFAKRIEEAKLLEQMKPYINNKAEYKKYHEKLIKIFQKTYGIDYTEVLKTERLQTALKDENKMQEFLQVSCSYSLATSDRQNQVKKNNNIKTKNFKHK